MQFLLWLMRLLYYYCYLTYDPFEIFLANYNFYNFLEPIYHEFPIQIVEDVSVKPFKVVLTEPNNEFIPIVKTPLPLIIPDESLPLFLTSHDSLLENQSISYEIELFKITIQTPKKIPR